MNRSIDLYVFCSIKGGVGKSTLAVACAKLLAARGDTPLLIDADLTGTSLADGLHLRAPKVALHEDGSLDLDALPTGELYTPEETRRLRNARKNANWHDRPPPPVYLNDALNYQGTEAGQECRIDGFLWRHEREDRVLYFPSSPLKQDVASSLGWIHGSDPFRWICRLTWIIDALLEQRQEITDVVMDLPPGVWEGGFSHEILVLVSILSREKSLPEGYPGWDGSRIAWKVSPFLVSTPDWNDLLPALEYAAANSALLPTLRVLLNRAGTESPHDFRERLRRRLDPALVDLGVGEDVARIDELVRSLGRLFRTGDLALDADVQALAGSMALEKRS